MVRVLFLDRDGTINVDRGYVSRVEDWEFAPLAVEALRRLRAAGFALAVVTNQSGVGRGYYTAEDVERLHQHMQSLLAAAGIAIDAVAYCPHAPEDGCACRKPLGGMAETIERQLQEPIDFAASWMIGDKEADVCFGRTIGARTILLESRYWSAERLAVTPTHTAASLADAARILLEEQS